ncbi:MAG: two-component system response regulator [Mucilaginibacter sp.]|nr:two-component system response regulator [Mucilaginibacter sp.]
MNTPEHKRLKILVVEDDPFINMILKRILSETYEVEFSNSVIKALAILQDGKMPDLLISDYNMPNMSGLELLVQLKSSGFFRFLPIIMLSGEDNPETRIKCLDNGADDYVLKPFNPQELLARIRAIMRRMDKAKGM